MDWQDDINNIRGDEPVRYVPYDNGFQKAAGIMGIASLITSFLGLITVPMILGGLAVILALLSRGRGSMSGRAVMGLSCGAAAIILNILIIFFAVYMFLFNVQYRKLVDEQSMKMYGYTITDMLEESMGDGFDIDSYLKYRGK